MAKKQQKKEITLTAKEEKEVKARAKAGSVGKKIFSYGSGIIGGGIDGYLAGGPAGAIAGAFMGGTGAKFSESFGDPNVSREIKKRELRQAQKYKERCEAANTPSRKKQQLLAAGNALQNLMGGMPQSGA